MTNDQPEGIPRGDEEIWFHFPPAYTRFGREEFCLIWIFEAFPSMRTYAIKNSNDIPRAITWKRIRQLDWDEILPYMTIDDEANYPLQTLIPTEAEVATDWWQASRHCFDETDDEDPPLFHRVDSPLRHRDPSPHPTPRHRDPSPHRADSLLRHRDPSPHRADSPIRHRDPSPYRADSTPRHRDPSPLADSTPRHRDPSPIPSHHRASSPPLPHVRRSAKMQRYLSPVLHLHGMSALRGEVSALRDDNGALRDEVGALREIVSSLQNEVCILREKRPDDILHDDHYNSEPDQPSTFRYMDTIFVARWGSRIRRHGPAITSPFTPIVPRLRKKKPDPPTIVQVPPPIIQDSPLIVQETPPIVQDPPPIVQDPPASFRIHIQYYVDILVNPLLCPICWIRYGFRIGYQPVPFLSTRYAHYRTQLRIIPFRLRPQLIFIYMSGARGVEDNGYFEWGKLKKLKETRWTIMPSSFHSTHLQDQIDASYALDNDKAILYPEWWEVNKVFIPVMERRHWGWTDLLSKYLDAIAYWTNSGNEKPNMLNVTIMRDETSPQQASIARGYCGPFVCMCLERMTRGGKQFLPPRVRDRGANNFLQALHSVVSGLRDPKLSVRVDSVFALRSFVEACKDLNDIHPILPQLLDGKWYLVLVLPMRMFDFLDAPIPFLVGLQQKPMDLKMKTYNLVQVNVLKNQVKTSHFPTLPRHRELLSELGPIHSRLSLEAICRHSAIQCSIGFSIVYLRTRTLNIIRSTGTLRWDKLPRCRTPSDIKYCVALED
ncbi:hypothetical protein F3Y22_tig00113724pilonHSYRG00152 [Hibiscus syriacus]|uniref:cDENN domain-containing protein n=1 Tax=Hibiscus syriacus TaxID=106335 RepID=A0A6A2WNI8_HIBSY|nr:hypothetical protein F3Y22_tig00113724pilonHSYRG00152 [Hibiscus syriacus]